MVSALLFALLLQAVAIPKNNPNGTWQSVSGTQFILRLNGPDLTVRLVPGSNPRYVQYEVNLKNDEKEVNTYSGKGFFVAKRENKECRFETEWSFIVVSDERIIGRSTNIVPDWDTCTAKETGDAELDLKKK